MSYRRHLVALVVTSPPYFAGKEYELALGEGHVPASYLDYLQMLEDVFAECVRTLQPRPHRISSTWLTRP
ncbi:MAG: hypothetical protein H6518_06965 [Microthrixaceae bacterium]|nr:hypothetical protein [Microthrixaceae bacterium]